MVDATSSPDAPAAAPKNTSSSRMGRGTVAKGRTVVAPTEDRQVVGYGQDGAPVYRPVDKHFGPGQEVRLPEEEIAHLRRTGFLIDPNAPAANVGNGPDYSRA